MEGFVEIITTIIVTFSSIFPFTIINTEEQSTIILNSVIIPSEHFPTMLVILSPQYANDHAIQEAISLYQKAVYDDLGWIIRLIPLTEKQNRVETIDNIIEEHHDTNPLVACLMIGEDLDTALGGDQNFLEKPSIVPWMTIGGTSAYTNTTSGILCKPYPIDICISLLYPTATEPYERKKTAIVSTLQKFSTKRDIKYDTKIQVFESSEINGVSRLIYQELDHLGNLSYIEDPHEEHINSLAENAPSLCFIHGHSNPSGTCLNKNTSVWFSPGTIDTFVTPFFGADGCYVNGWWSEETDNNYLDKSINMSWYGSAIFTSTELYVMALGLLSQTGYNFSVNFIEQTIPEIIEGETLAESMIGDHTLGDVIIIGDPTFHFTL